MTSLPDALSVLVASQVWISMNWKPYSLWYSFISLQVRTETCIVTSQAVICFVTEKRILFSKLSIGHLYRQQRKNKTQSYSLIFLSRALIKWNKSLTALQWLVLKQAWVTYGNLMQILNIFLQSSTTWSSGAGEGQLKLLCCSPALRLCRAVFTSTQHPSSQPQASRPDVDVVWQWRGLMCSHSDARFLRLLNHTECIGLRPVQQWPAWPPCTWAIFLTNSILMKY